MINVDLNLLARFPFTSKATEYIKSLNLSIDNILDSMAYQPTWRLGKQRLIEAIETGEIKDHGSTIEAEYVNELLSYVIARVIVSCISDTFLVRRYALAEAVSAYRGLKEMSLQSIADIALELGISPVKIGPDSIDLELVQYLEYATAIRAPEYKLVNRDVATGLVSVSGRELARLVQEALRLKIQNELPIQISDELVKKIMPKVQDITTLIKNRKQHFETKDLGKVSITRFPPCMKHILGMTQSGENVPHVGRFAIASFLHNIGLSSDDILKLFSASPDFDVDKARYQVEHITGKISGTEYTPPSCDSMKSNGICVNPDSLCKNDWLNHPMKYYRIKGKKKNK